MEFRKRGTPCTTVAIALARCHKDQCGKASSNNSRVKEEVCNVTRSQDTCIRIGEQQSVNAQNRSNKGNQRLCLTCHCYGGLSFCRILEIPDGLSHRIRSQDLPEFAHRGTSDHERSAMWQHANLQTRGTRQASKKKSRPPTSDVASTFATAI